MDRRQGSITFNPDPEARKAELEEKIIDGSISDEERMEYGELDRGGQGEEPVPRGLASDNIERDAKMSVLQGIKDRAEQEQGQDMFSRHSELIQEALPDQVNERRQTMREKYDMMHPPKDDEENGS